MTAVTLTSDEWLTSFGLVFLIGFSAGAALVYALCLDWLRK